MSDTTDNGNTTDTTDEPTKAELHDRVEKLESTVEKLMPSRRDALKLGAAGIAGAAGLSATTQPADAATGSAGQIGDSSNRPDAFLDEANVNQLTGVSAGADRQGCRVFLSSSQSISSGPRVKIQFDSEVYDSGNNFDTSSHNWTCPADGLYAVNLQIEFAGGGNGDNRSILIGTASDTEPTDFGSRRQIQDTFQFEALQSTIITRRSSGDTIAGYARNNTNSDTLDNGAGAGETFMEIAFLGGL